MGTLDAVNLMHQFVHGVCILLAIVSWRFATGDSALARCGVGIGVPDLFAAV